jgi:hypothetical protein
MRKLIFHVLAFGLAAGCGNAFTAAGTTAGGGSSSAGASGGASGGASEGDSAGAAGATDSESGGNGGSAGSTGQAGSIATGGGAGSDGHAGTNAGGSGGSAGGGPTCAELFSRAKVQLDEASVCDTAAKVQQCTGTVTTTCGCEAPVEKNDSTATKAYLSTLAEISQKNCHQNCPLIACVPVTNPKCSVPVGSTSAIGTCTSGLP